MDGPVDLVAQSMGGVIAARLAIERPQNVRRLVLTVTSGGVDMAGLGASRLACRLPQVVSRRGRRVDHRSRLPSPLPVEKIAAPTLLLWGDADPISPAAVGRHLKRASRMRVCTSCAAAP